MPLRLYRRKSGIFHIRGSHHGIAVDESSLTRERAAAEAVRERREREIYEAVILGKRPDRLFAEAAEGLMLGRGAHPDNALFAPILVARVMFGGKRTAFGEVPLREIDQAMIDAIARQLYPDAKNSTRNRKVYTPVSAALTWASEQKSWQFQHGRIRRPKQTKGRLDWRTPQEIEWWLARAGHAAPLVAAYVGTGARASELIGLDWANVSPANHQFTLWEDETKAETERSVELQLRVRAVLPPRPPAGGRVWLKPDGTPWAGYDSINNLLRRISEREALARAAPLEAEELAEKRALARTLKVVGLDVRRAAATRARAIFDAIIARERIPTIHCHIFRHTWATWAYAVTRDMPWVMARGGWSSPALAMRYIHVGSADLAEDVLAHGWEIRAGIGDRPKALPAPAKA